MAKIKNIILLIMATTTLLNNSSAFLLVDNCPAPSPCTCSGSSSSYSYVYCQSKSLKDIPFIKQSNNHVDTLYLYFYSNALTVVYDNVFRNISSINASNIILQLNSNKINTIENNAFNGIENVTSNLRLNSNNLTTIPSAIGKLVNLEYLYIYSNPLHSIDSSVMSNIGRSLIHLNHLTSLNFRYDTHLKENRSSIFEPCTGKLSTVTNLYLDGNNLHVFPDVFTLFPSLTTLSLSSNKLEYIESSKLPSIARVTTIYLNNNLFERIPPALNRLKSLNILYIYNNNIKTIELADLSQLSMLTYLHLNNNPIVYISPTAFKHNLNLGTLYLQNTNLDHVPVAATYLTKLRNLYLSGRPIDCSCDMSYLKHWNATAVTNFNTKCASSTETIKTFVTNSLQSCP
ncbi:decorin-like [Mercenaria mercenaria]|uniref:decorin-like n=1 Tax=Mercenaria mercenaria TaxID=6596 RepID=UPI00234ED98D|nr:decorin-like [Mercenaria mercenaria]